MELHLPPDVESILREQAAAAGMNTEQFAVVALQHGLEGSEQAASGAMLPHDKWKKTFEALVASFPERNGSSRVDCDRDSIYGDRGR